MNLSSPEREKFVDMCGTRGFIAPEVLSHGFGDYKVDIWSVGVIAAELVYLANSSLMTLAFRI